MARPSTLAKPSPDLVLGALRKQRAPMTAYALLEALKPHGIKSPPIIYRALETLIAEEKVHKIQALNAFVACDCTTDHDHALSVLMVCSDCHQVRELHDHAVLHHLEALGKHGVTLAPHAVIELPVQCTDCLRA